jgi:hypothetical protein
MFKTILTSFINPTHELCLMAKKIDWDDLEKEFEPLYGTVGKPSIPIHYRVLTQQRNDKNKVYSIHEPDVLCILRRDF